MSLKGLRFTFEVDGLSPESFTVVNFSLAQHYSLPFGGTSFTVPSPAARIEMKNIHTDFSQGNLTDIPLQIRSMKRLWIGRGLDGLINRREGEAKLFEEGLAQ